MLHVEHLTKRYGHLAALSEVSFSIHPGEILGLIGPNGSGKTTLFECLGGVLAADAGGLLRDARRLASREQTSTVFYLPDGIAPWPTETVRWALDFAVGYFGVRHVSDTGQIGVRHVSDTGQIGVRHASDTGLTPVSAPMTRMAEVIRRLDLEPLLDSPIGTLSKGQRKRALLAIGLLTPHPILLADEPFDGLDLRQTRDVAQTLRHYAARGRTMLLSIHQIADSARVCDRFVLLSGGRTRGEGTLDELSALAAARGHATRDLEEIFLALT